jgi:carbohydrate kinase (thermoresistant glucokinase family)
MPVPFVIVMGVTGSGKTTLGRRIALHFGVHFFDADDFHPRASIEKMVRGVPLDDADRAPWLRRLAEVVESHPDGGVLACSALKRAYRNVLDPRSMVVWVHLACTPELALARLANRRQHFMPASLVQSQFATLEDPENAITIDSSASTDDQLAKLCTALASPPASQGGTTP